MPRPKPDRSRESLDDLADNQSSGQSGTLGSATSLDSQREEGSRFQVEYPASTRVYAYKYVPDDEDEFDSGVGNLCVRFIKQGNRKKIGRAHV